MELNPSPGKRRDKKYISLKNNLAERLLLLALNSSLILGLCVVGILCIFVVIAVYQTFFKHRHFFSKSVAPVIQSDAWSLTHKIRYQSYQCA